MRQKGVFSTDMTESFESALAKTRREVFLEGVHDGMPIALGYFVVSFTLGIAARNAGLDPLQGFLASFFNNASAGEYAGFTVIEADAPYLEIVLITLVANARYMLMSCALSQKFQPGTSIWHRIFVGFDVTDEIFGITIARKGPLNPYYNYGAMALALPGWAVARRRRRQHPAACRRQRPLRRALRHVPLGHHPASQEEPHRWRPRARELRAELPRLRAVMALCALFRHAHDHPDCPDCGHRRRTLPHPRTTGTRRLPGRR